MRSRGRLDKFSNQIYSNSIREKARPDHTFSTEQYLDAQYNIVTRAGHTDEEKDYFYKTFGNIADEIYIEKIVKKHSNKKFEKIMKN